MDFFHNLLGQPGGLHVSHADSKSNGHILSPLLDALDLCAPSQRRSPSRHHHASDSHATPQLSPHVPSSWARQAANELFSDPLFNPRLLNPPFKTPTTMAYSLLLDDNAPKTSIDSYISFVREADNAIDRVDTYEFNDPTKIERLLLVNYNRNICAHIVFQNRHLIKLRLGLRVLKFNSDHFLIERLLKTYNNYQTVLDDRRQNINKKQRKSISRWEKSLSLVRMPDKVLSLVDLSKELYSEHVPLSTDYRLLIRFSIDSFDKQMRDVRELFAKVNDNYYNAATRDCIVKEMDDFEKRHGLAANAQQQHTHQTSSSPFLMHW